MIECNERIDIMENDDSSDPHKQKIKIYQEFQQILSDSNQEQRYSTFLSLISDFESFLFQFRDPESHKFSSELLPQLMDFEVLANKHLPTFIQFMRLLSHSSSLKVQFSLSQVKITGIILVQALQISINSASFIQIAKPFFDYAFHDSKFMTLFYKNGYVLNSLNDIFRLVKEPAIAKWGVQYLIYDPSPSLFPLIPTVILFNFFSSLNEELRQNLLQTTLNSLILETMTIMFLKFCKSSVLPISNIYKEGNAFEFLGKVLNQIPSVQWVQYFDQLLCAKDTLQLSQITKPNIFSPDTFESCNYVVLKWIHELCPRANEIHNQIFDLVHPFMISKENIYQINEVFPIVDWFSSYCQPIHVSTTFLSELDNLVPELVKPCLSLYLDKLTAYDDSDETPYFESLQIIKHQLKLGYINHLYLYESRFLDAFIVTIGSTVMEKLGSKTEVIHDLFNISLATFQLKEAKSDQQFVFQALLQTTRTFSSQPAFFIWISEFLIASPSPENISFLFDIISFSKDPNLCNIFLSVFTRSSYAEESFIKANGLKWLNDSLSSGLISIDLYASIFASISIASHFDEIEDFVVTLPNDHPLFSLHFEKLEKIVFGLNRSPYRPIRVYHLFPLLPFLNSNKKFIYKFGDKNDENSIKLFHVDPYNSFIIGKYCLEQYLTKYHDIFSIPLIVPIANRFIPSKYINYLMENPFELEKFCDLSYDHFPLFQFFQGSKKLSSKIPHLGISFWVKAVMDSNSVTFFENDFVSLTLMPNEIQISFSGEKGTDKTIRVDVTKWIHIMIYAQTDVHHKLSLNVFISNFNSEGELVEHSIPLQESGFTYASFSSSGIKLLFLGPAIRFYRFKYPNPTIILSKGPSFIDEISTCTISSKEKYDERIITPYSLDLNHFSTIPSNCVTVPYYGVPFHFLSSTRMINLIHKLEEAKNSEEFESLFMTLLKINQIISKKSDKNQFWPRLLDEIKHCKKFVNKKLFLLAIHSISIQASALILPSLIYDPEMWLSVDNNILVSVIFESMSDFDWQSIPDFELFISKIILSNPTSTSILLTILQNSSRVPTLIAYIFGFLSFSHILVPSQKDSILNDHNIPSITWNDFLDKAKFESVLKHCIIDSLAEFTNSSPSNLLLVKQWLPFSKIKDLMYVGSKKVNAKLFHLAIILKEVTVDEGLLPLIAQLVSSRSVWEDVLSLELWPLLAVLLWGASLVMIRLTCGFLFQTAFINDENEKLEIIKKLKIVKLNLRKIEALYGEGLITFESNADNALNDPLVIHVLTSWFPFILNASAAPIHEKETPEEISNISQPTPLLPTEFMGKMITKVINSFISNVSDSELSSINLIDSEMGFITDIQKKSQSVNSIDLSNSNQVLSTPKRRNSNCDFSSEAISILLRRCILEHPLFKVECRLIYHSSAKDFNSLFQSFFLSLPFYSPSLALVTVPSMLRIFFSTRYSSINVPLTTILEYAHLFVGMQCFDNQQGAEFLSDFLDFLRKQKEVFVHKETFCICILQVIIGLFINSSSINDSIILLENLLKFDGLFVSLLNSIKYQNTAYAWAYCFNNIGLHNTTKFPSLNVIFEQLIGQLRASKSKHVSLFTSAIHGSLNQIETNLAKSSWTEQISSFLSTYNNLYQKIIHSTAYTHFNEDVQKLSKVSCDENFKSNNYNFHNAQNYLQNSSFLDSTFLLNEERTQWNLFLSTISLERSNLHDFINKERIAIEEHKTKLSYQCLPFQMPSLISIKSFKDDAYEQYSNHCLKFISEGSESSTKYFRLFLKTAYSIDVSVGNNEAPITVLGCQIQRNNYSIPSVFFLYSHVCLILTFASMKYEITDLEFKEMTKENSSEFIEDVFLGDWGNTSIFMNHIVIQIPKNNLFAKTNKKTSITIWSLKNGHFIINFDYKIPDLEKTIKALLLISDDYLQSTFGYIPTLTFHDSLSLLKTSQISVRQFLLILNALSSRFSADSQNPPIFPSQKLSEKDFKNPLNFFMAYCSYQDLIPYKDPAIQSELWMINPKKQKKISSNIRFLESPENLSNIFEWARSHFEIMKDLTPEKVGINLNYCLNQKTREIFDINENQVFQQIKISISKDRTIVFDNEGISLIKPLSVALDIDHYAIIDNTTFTLSIYSISSKKLSWSLTDPTLLYASSISLSGDGSMLCIDFDFGLTHIYKLNHSLSDSNLFNITFINEFSWTETPKSYSSGIYSICGTIQDRKLVLWNIATATIHREIIFTEKINFLCFDDYSGIFWVIINSTIFCITINGDIVAKEDRIKEEFTVAKANQSHNGKSFMHLALGTKSGKIIILRVDSGQIDFKELESIHESAIKNIIIHPKEQMFISIDSNNKTLLWTGIGILLSHPLKLDYFEKCSICGQKCEVICRNCHRAICKKCLSENSTCIQCLALDAYY